MSFLLRSASLALLLPTLIGLYACASTTATKGSSVSPAAEQAPSSSDEAAAVSSVQSRPLALWQVSREGQPSSYLFGTCHAGVSVEESLPAKHGVLLTGAAKFVMEVDPSTMDPVMMQERLKLPEGKKLSELMGAELWATLGETFELGPAAEAFDELHPFALLGYVISNMANEMAQRTTRVPMDFTLSRMAADAGVEQGFLESLDEQLDLFLNWPMDEMIQGLADLARPEALEEMKNDLDAVLEVCRSGDESGLLALSAKSPDSDWEQRLLIERNKKWIPKLEEFFASGSTFVAAGAAHMFGQEGVPELLRARGFTVERMEGVTSAPSAPVAAPSGAAADTLPLSFLTGQIEAQAASTLCADDMVPVQCHGVTPEKCRGVLTQAVQQCAVDLDLPAEIAQEDLMGSVQQLGPCVVPQFQKMLPPEQEVQSDGCKAAYETLK